MLSDDMKKLTKEQKDIIESRRQDIEGIMKVLTVMYTPFIESSDYYSYSPKKLTREQKALIERYQSIPIAKFKKRGRLSEAERLRRNILLLQGQLDSLEGKEKKGD